jgi:hypothetical protein
MAESQTIKYYQPKIKPQKLMKTAGYQKYGLKSLQVLTDPETPLTPTNANQQPTVQT